MTTTRAQQLGEQAGKTDAARWSRDHECFDEIPNPFGVDSEAGSHEAWAEGYENEFELKR